jgi:hypothetical protein
MTPEQAHGELAARLDNYRAHCRNIAAGMRAGTSAPSEIAARGPKLASWLATMEALAATDGLPAFNATQERDVLGELATLKPLAQAAGTLARASFTEKPSPGEAPLGASEPRTIALAIELDKMELR